MVSQHLFRCLAKPLLCLMIKQRFPGLFWCWKWCAQCVSLISCCWLFPIFVLLFIHYLTWRKEAKAPTYPDCVVLGCDSYPSLAWESYRTAPSSWIVHPLSSCRDSWFGPSLVCFFVSFLLGDFNLILNQLLLIMPVMPPAISSGGEIARSSTTWRSRNLAPCRSARWSTASWQALGCHGMPWPWGAVRSCEIVDMLQQHETGKRRMTCA